MAESIGIDESSGRHGLCVLGETARRLASVSVPLLCGTTSPEQLIRLLDSVSLLAPDLQDHPQVAHYVQRICFYLERNPNPELRDKITSAFPKLVEKYREEKWMAGQPTPPVISGKPNTSCRRPRVRERPDIFDLPQNYEEEKVALLTMADLRESLPSVAFEMAGYETAWRRGTGTTALALGLELEGTEPPPRPATIAEEGVRESIPETEAARPTYEMPKPRTPKTGREVVDHILGGMLTDQTYIAYLNKPFTTKPYHLIVVPKSKLNKEHFIISSVGGMHVIPNGENGKNFVI